jgi:hypothetical protein
MKNDLTFLLSGWFDISLTVHGASHPVAEKTSL